MGIFGSVSSKEVDEFARSLVAEIAKYYPPSPDAAAQRKVSQRKVASVLEGALKKAVDFKNQHRLGIYKTARLGNTVSKRLSTAAGNLTVVDINTPPRDYSATVVDADRGSSPVACSYSVSNEKLLAHRTCK